MEFWKRLLSALLALLLLVGTVPPAGVRAAETETTVPVETTDSTESTEETVPEETVPEETEPPVIITRGQWLSMLVNTFEYSIPAGVTLDDYYTDLYDDHEYYEDIQIAIYNGLVDVLPNNPMEPDEPATREFAAFTLNSCMGGYPAGEDYSFSEAEEVTYANDIQVAIERGWFALSEGAFLPEAPITEAEAETMMADAQAYLDSLVIEEDHENGYTFKEGVVEITDYAEIEFGDGTSVIRIYDISQPLEEGDTFVVYSDGLAIPFRADALTATAEYTEVTATDLYFQDAIETMDVQMSMAADPLNFAPAEGAELVFIEEESGEEVTAEYASYAMDRGIKKIFIPKFTKTFELSEGAKIEVEVEFKNAKVNYNTEVEFAKASVSVWLDGDAEVTTKLSSKKDLFKPVEIPVGTYEVPGVGGINLYLKCDVTGSISMVMKTKMKLGVTMSWTPFLPAPIATAIYESKPYSSSVNADITAKIYLECNIGFYGKALPVKGYLFGETGFKANVKYTTYQEITGHCTHFAAYFFAEYGARVSWEIIGESEFEFQPDDKYMIKEANSPIKIVKHYEDGVERAKCTRENLSGTTTGDSSALMESGHNTGSSSGNSSSGLSSGSSKTYDDSGNMVTLYTYSLDSDYNATITKYNGNAASLSIPTSLDGYPVVAIGSSAFSGKTNLQTVVMPDSITTIGGNAFYNCTGLRNISFPSSLTSIGSSAFAGCKSLTAVSIPDSVTAIGAQAFHNCTRLQFLHLPKSLTALDYFAFYNCDSLKSVHIPKGLLSAGYANNTGSMGAFNSCDNLTDVTFEDGTVQVAAYLFANCPGLVSVTLPDTITSINDYAFYNCANLTNVEMADSVTTIGGNAFAGCIALKNIPLSRSLTTIGSYAFSNCDSLVKVEMPDTVSGLGSHVYYDCGALAEVKLSKNLTSMYAYTFYNCDALTAVEIPRSLQTTYEARPYSNGGDWTYGPFIGCNGLKTVTFEEGATTVAQGLLANLPGLTSIVLPDSITSIGGSAFRDSTKLVSVTLSANTETIGNSAFYNCTGLTELDIPGSVTVIGGSAFSDCTNLADVTFHKGLLTIGGSAFYNCTSLTVMALPDTVTTIEASAFRNCESLQQMHLPKSLTTLAYYAFYNCDSLKSVHIPKGLLSAGYANNTGSMGAFNSCDNLTDVTFEEGTPQVATYLFANCPGLVSVTLPDTITSINDYAFYNCANLTGVEMVDSVTTIGGNAFAGCIALENIPLSQSLTTIGSYAFSNCDSLVKVEIPDTVTGLGSHVYYDCGALAEVKLSKNLTSMYAYTFYNCDALTAIEIPKRLQTTYEARPYSNSGDWTYGPFIGCNGLKTVTFEDGATVMPRGLLANCPGIESIEIPEGITTIGLVAFQNCSSLAEVKLPDTVTVIDSQAFKGSTALADIDLPASVTTIGSEAFSNCDSLVSVNMPDSVTSLGTNAYYDCTLLEHIHLSEGLTKLQDSTFYNCDALKDIEIPDSITTIGNNVFYDSDALVTARIGEGVTTIGNGMFYDCDALTTVTMGDAVTTMGTHVFYHNDVLESVELSMQLTTIPQYSFYTCPKLTEIVIPYYVTTIGDYAFNASPKLAKVVTRSNLTSIASNAFSYPNVTVFHGDAGSYTETWAGNNGYSFVANEVPATGVTLSPKTLTMAKGTSAQLYLTVTPANHSDAVAFKSSNENVVTVDAAGKITAKGVGTATVKVIVGNYSASCKVTVTQIITGMSINASSVALKVPNTYQLTATIRPTDASNQVLRWTSSNEKAATVDENGLVTAVGNGTAVITAETTDGSNFSRSCTFTVTDPNNIPVTKITLNKTTASMDALQTMQLTATVTPTNAANKGVVWSSSDETVATVDENGLVTALAKGAAQITASAADGFGAATTCMVTVMNTAYIVTDPALLESAHNYPIDCTDLWVYTVEGVEALKLTFDERTALEEEFDFLYIYDGGDNLIGSYTGTALAGQTVQILGNTVKLRLDTDSLGTDWGFKVINVEEIGHLHTYVAEVTEPTCTEGGFTTYTCSECGDSYTADSTEATGHSFTETVTGPTCTEGGFTTYVCDVCGHSETGAETEALGHDLRYSQSLYPATCTEDGKAIYTCSRCSYSELVTQEAPGHSHETVVTEPTCTEGGYTTYTCTVCGEIHVGDETEPTGHSFTDWSIEGTVQTRTCTLCGLGEVGCTGHIWSDWKVTEEPGCTEAGVKIRECVGCGEAELGEIPPTGHSYSETVMAPTCTEPGGTVHTCDGCGDSYTTDPTEALGHEVEEGACIRCETVFLQILTQPEDVTAADGEIIRVTVEAEGKDLTYAWYYKNANGTRFAKTNAFKGNTYTMAMSEARSGRRIYCVITDANGYSMTTDTVLLTMAQEPPVTILTQPVSVTVSEGETAEVTVEAEGEGLIYEWYFRNAGRRAFSKTAAFDGPVYSVTMTEARSGRQIYCIITDAYGNSVTTDTVTLTMAVTVLEIISQPASVTVADGEMAEVTVEATGDGLTYEWYYKNANGSTFSKTASFTGPSYCVTMSASRDGRQVYCVITDAYGNSVTTDTVTLSMEQKVQTPLEIVTQPEGFTVAAGETGEITLEALGDGLTYTWYYKNAAASKFSKTSTFTGPSYSLTMNGSRSGRHVYCVVSDAYGNSEATDIVTLNMVSDLELLSQPEDVTVASGETAVITVDAVGEDMTYTWYYRNAGASSFTRTDTFTGDAYSLKMTSARSGRQVYCVVTDGSGNTVATDIVTLYIA